MSTTTISVRDVDLDVWKEFQKRIIDLYGSLYGQLGTEVTEALRLWLEENEETEREVSGKYVILNVGRNHTVRGNPNLKTLLEGGLWGLKDRYRKQWGRINIGDEVLVYCDRGIRAKGKVVNKEYNPKEPITDWDDPYGYPYRVELELENVNSKKKLPEVEVPLSELERKNIFTNHRFSVRVIEDPGKVGVLEELLRDKILSTS